MNLHGFCPRAVIFDMDGLLIDSEPIWEQVEDGILTRRNLILDPAVRARYIGMRMADFWRGLSEAYALNEPIHLLIAEAVDTMAARVGTDAALRPGAADLIALLQARGIPCAIASSSPMAIIDAVVAAHGWETLFARRVSGDDVTHGKPAPDIYLEAALRIGVDPADCLALEDSLNGTRAAVAARMVTVAVPDLAHTSAAAFDGVTPYIFESLHDVRAALEGCRFDA
ncbi:MAG: HAD family phosphatase [Chloroflexota bacterium]|nr:HAD family phosphatase [Chloroflexota bacterium]